MLDFISLYSDSINIQVSGSSATEYLESILIQIKGESLNELSVDELDTIQVSKIDNALYNQKRYLWRVITDGFVVNLDPDEVVE